LRLWIGGDSLGDTPGQSLIDQLGSNKAVGIIGPLRMDYPRAIIAVRQAASELSRVVTEVYDE